MNKTHLYKTHLTWIGHREGDRSFRRHNRSYVIEGDNMSSCYHLWSMYLCGHADITVLASPTRISPKQR